MITIMIIGATSAIAQATARLYAVEGARMFLVARQADKLNSIASDLLIRGATQVETAVMNTKDYDQHLHVIDQAFDKLNGLDIVLIAYGTLPDQKTCEMMVDKALIEFEVNCLSIISFLSHLANRFQQQGKGTIAVITSVAGDRGRQSNYLYGAAKGAVSIFLQGLRNRLHQSHVNVLTIKPGLVDTPMTKSFTKGILWSQPDKIANGIQNAIKHKKNIVYLPPYWKMIMLIIRLIPERFFKHLNL